MKQSTLTPQELGMCLFQEMYVENHPDPYNYGTMVGIEHDMDLTIVLINKNGDRFKCRQDEVKPIKRHLSDMTEEEAIEIAAIIYGKPDSIKWRVERNKITNAFLVYRKHYSKRFVICLETGEIECYDMHAVDEQKDIYNNQHYVTKYLIEKGFDIFGWIGEGKAIDKTKL